jgi:flagellar motor switch protein FliN/FliY
MTQEEIDALIKGGLPGAAPDAATIAPGATAPFTVETPAFPEFTSADMGGIHDIEDTRLQLLYDLQLPVSIELGRTNMLIRDILKLGRGSVIEFDKLVSEPVDVLVNGKKVAEGEVVVVDKHFGIRITTLIDPSDRLRSLKR